MELVETRAGFDALEHEWGSLFARAGTSQQVFQSFNWCWHWCNHYLAGDASGAPRLSIVTGRIEGRLAMVWPLVVGTTLGCRIAGFMGDPVGQYGDVLVDAGPSRDTLLEEGLSFIKRHVRADALVLRKVRSDCTIGRLLRQSKALPVETQEAPFADLRYMGDMRAYEASLPSSHKKNRRRHRRRLGEHGGVTTSVLREGDEAGSMMALAVAMKRSTLAERGLYSRAFADARFDRFFADVATSRERPTGCRIGVLRVDGRPVAIEVGFRCRDRLAAHIKVYDPAFEKHSPGQLLTEDVIRDLFAEGPAVYDLLAPNVPYKADWAHDTTVVTDWAIPISTRGRLYISGYFGGGRCVARALLARLPCAVRRRLRALIARYQLS